MCWESVTKWWGPDEKCSNLFSPADRPQPMFPHDTLWMWERKQTWLPVYRFGNINYNNILSSVKLGIRFWKHLNDFLTPLVEFSFLCRAEVRIDWERLVLMSNTKYFHDKLTVSLFSLYFIWNMSHGLMEKLKRLLELLFAINNCYWNL